MANPVVPQGTLNLLRSSAQFISFPQLNVSASYLSKGMISLTFEGEPSGYLPTATGAVPSPNPYMIVTLMMHMVRSQSLANTWKSQIETSTTIGDIVVTGDASTLSQYYLSNCTVKTLGELAFAGADEGYPITCQGTYYINSNLFNQQ